MFDFITRHPLFPSARKLTSPFIRSEGTPNQEGKQIPINKSAITLIIISTSNLLSLYASRHQSISRPFFFSKDDAPTIILIIHQRNIKHIKASKWIRRREKKRGSRGKIH
jgi:hypothetical protein